MIVILDPGWPDPEHMVLRYDAVLEFKDALRFVAGRAHQIADDRVLVIKKTTARGLQDALTATPLKKRDVELSAIACLDGQPFLQLTNHGYDLEPLMIQVFPRIPQEEPQPLLALRMDPATKGERFVVIDRLGHGETVRVFFDVDAPGRGTVSISGSTWRSHISQTFEVETTETSI